MSYRNRCARINLGVLVILVTVVAVVGVSLVVARQVRRQRHAQASLAAGQAAFESKDWPTAAKRFREYLLRHPDDIGVLRRYGVAALSTRPLDGHAISGALSAYRQIVQLEPRDEAASEKLVLLYAATANYEEIVSLARLRLDRDPADRKASLWLADALVRLDRAVEARQTFQTLLGVLEALSEKHPEEYVHACVRMSNLSGNVSTTSAPEATDRENPGMPVTPQQWLDKAVEYAPDSVEARIHRARLYRQLAEASEDSEGDPATQLELARQDLDTADTVGTDDPQLRCFLGAEWMALGELNRASAELEAVARLPDDLVADRFLDLGDWTAAKFLFASQLAVRTGRAAQALSLAEEALASLSENRHRVQVLPPAIQLYVSAGRTVEARCCLNEYLGLLQTQKPSVESSAELAALQAIVARAEGRPYAVIDALQSVALAGNPSEARILGPFLVEAYNQTDQPGRAIQVLLQGLRRWPQDVQMRGQLARQYVALGDWDKAVAAAAEAEAIDPSNWAIKLLRIRAGVNLAIGQADQIDVQKLKKLGDELVELRQVLPEEADVRILQAIIADGLGQPEEAERELKLAVDQCQEPRKAEMQLARHYRQIGRTVDAIHVCQAACERHSQEVETWLFLAELHLVNADPNAARRCLQHGWETVVSESGKHALSIQLALVDLGHGDRAAAIRLLRTLAAQDKQDVQTRALLLETREIQDDRSAAETLVAELRQTEGESGLWWRLYRASVWLSSTDWRSKQQDILNLLQYCINADPVWSTPVLLLARMYEELGDSSRVEETYRAALLQNPSDVDIADRLLTLLEKQGRLSEADRILPQVDKTDRLADAWQIRVAVGAGNLSRAIDLLQRRASNDSQDALSQIQLAQLVYRKTKDAGQALEYLKEAETFAPGSRPVAAMRAFILQAEGKKAEALQVLDDYVAHHPDFEAYRMRAAYLAQQGEAERAESDYQKLTTFPQRGALAYQLLGSFYADAGKLDQAVAALETGLRGHPEDLTLQRCLMQVLLRRSQVKDRERAFEILAALETRLPQDTELTTLQALQMMSAPAPQSFAEIQGKLEDAIKREPTAVNAHLALIAIAMRAREYRVACDYAVRAMESVPNSPLLLLARSRAELMLGYTPMAVKLAQAALQQDPNSIEALNVLVQGAATLADRKFLSEVRARIDLALGRNPGNEKLLLAKAHALTALELPQEAIPALQAYCQTEEGRNSIAALVTLADLCRLAGDVRGAKSWIEQAQRLGTGSQAVVHARCLWLLSQKRFDELTGISSAYVAAKDQDLTIVLRAAALLDESNSAKLRRESVKLFEHAANLFPTSIDARTGLASTLYRTGEGQRAKKIYQELRQQYPDNVRILNDLAWILQEQDHQYEAALELANRGLHLAPDDKHLLDTRATILTNLPNRLVDAKADFVKLTQQLPAQTREKAQALLRLGRVCLKLSDSAEAKQYLQNALEIDRQINVFTAAERLEITQIIQPSGQ